ncbi:MAG: hypothetical protein K2G83_00705 [Ruminococcus sp.]|nr:hypothetical protein [Ruminococcus sp.]
MKKFLSISLIVALICTVSSCSNEKTESSSMQSSSESSVETSGTKQSETSKNTEPVTTEQVTESKMTTESVQTIISTDASIVSEVQITTASENYEHIDVSEGIVFDAPVAEQSDNELIEAALALFQSACKTEWDYTVGSPYELDMNQTVQNQFGWDCYLVTTEGINSLADVRADYHKIFSENYNDTLDEVFMEANGRVYCLNGSRGADIFYNKSVITSVNSRSESEISFTVMNYFSGDDFGNEAYTMDEDFVISIDSDDVWRVSRFRLPY